MYLISGNQNIENNSNPKGYAISNIFEYGFEVVESFIEAAYKIPLRKGAKIALSNLLTFWLKDIKSKWIGRPYCQTWVENFSWSYWLKKQVSSKLHVYWPTMKITCRKILKDFKQNKQVYQIYLAQCAICICCLTWASTLVCFSSTCKQLNLPLKILFIYLPATPP